MLTLTSWNHEWGRPASAVSCNVRVVHNVSGTFQFDVECTNWIHVHHCASCNVQQKVMGSAHVTVVFKTFLNI